MTEKIRVQVVENSLLDEAGLRCLIGGCEGFEVVKQTECGPGCRQNCACEAPDVLVMELSVNGAKSIDCIRQILARQPNAHILAICPQGEPAACQMAISSGAIGFISKQTPTHMFIGAVYQVAQGNPFIEPWVAQRMVEKHGNDGGSPFEFLSKREHAILQLMLAGEGNPVIANRLGISINTLGNHRSHIKTKVGATNMVELIRLAMRHGIIR
ncbi:MAG: response regulator transcription factor [Mariprofundaceae bacterium]|nr:response regulator transcription factor [Mariprofundaceae bacterium]